MSESIKVRKQPQAHCKDCSLSGLCLPLSLNMQDMGIPTFTLTAFELNER